MGRRNRKRNPAVRSWPPPLAAGQVRPGQLRGEPELPEVPEVLDG
jgi:hypothetical protein